MKNLFNLVPVTLLLIFASGSSFAATVGSVKVNDTVTYEGTLLQVQPATPAVAAGDKPVPAPATPAPAAPKQPQTIGFIQQLSIASFDATSGNYTVNETLYLPDGSAKKDQQTVGAADLKSRQEIQTILKNCQASGGVPERLTVSGGTFDTCSVDDGKGNKTWLGDVPFNVVKQITTDDSKNVITIQVSLFSFGK